MERKEIIVVTNPMIAANRSTEVTLSKFLRVIKASGKSIEVIGGNLSIEQDINDVVLNSFQIIRHPNKLKRILAVVGVQFKMMISIMNRGKKNQPAYFWIADKMILPYFAAKIKKMEVNYFIYGNVEKEGRRSKFTDISGRLIRYMASHATFVCMESPSVKNEWTGLVVKKEKIIHLYTDIVSEPEYKGRTNTLGMVCRLTPGKHIAESIEAMVLIHNNHPDWILEVIGSGKQEQECKDLINKYNAKSYVHMLGWVEHSELHNYVSKWKYLLFPTDTEGMPNGLVEMMGYGIPAIASPVGGIADIIRESENGLLLMDCSVEAIEKCIEKAIVIPEETYRLMAANAYKAIAENFTLDAAQKAGRKYL